MVRNRIRMVTASILALTAAVVLVQGQTPPPTPSILWEESFNYGPANTAVVPNPSIWGYDVGHNDGWGNGELQTYTSELGNVRVENGNLIITAIGNQGTFTSGRINTKGKLVFKYGTITMKALMPDVVKGLWPAFWTLGQGFDTVGWPKCGELNVAELGQGLGISEGVGNKRVVSAAHWQKNGQYATDAGWSDYSENLNGTYHFYTMDWTKSSVTTYVDDQKIWSIDITNGTCIDCEALHDFHFILLSLAIGGGFTSGSTSSSSAGSSSAGCGSSSSSGNCGSLLTPGDITAPLPAFFQVDWIRIFDNGDTVVLDLSSQAPATVDVPVASPITTAPVPVPAPEPVPAPVPVPTAEVPVAPVPVPTPVTASPTATDKVVSDGPTVFNSDVPTYNGNIIGTATPTASSNLDVTGEPTLTAIPTVTAFPTFPDGTIIFPIFRPRPRRPRPRRPSRPSPVSSSSKGKGGKGSGKGSSSKSKSKASKKSKKDSKKDASTFDSAESESTISSATTTQRNSYLAGIPVATTTVTLMAAIAAL